MSENFRDAPAASQEVVAELCQEFHEDEQTFLDIDASPRLLGRGPRHHR
ncbi:MAG TPA: hypothetical protein PLV13_01520 [Ilumatobacteraceae bacterium]|nr:hypothetical protein [Ilumatobacteraceae bacterium]